MVSFSFGLQAMRHMILLLLSEHVVAFWMFPRVSKGQAVQSIFLPTTDRFAAWMPLCPLEVPGAL